MSEASAWKYSTVQAFLESYNWSGKPLSVPSDSPEAKETVSWPRQTVQIFFRDFNWTGRSVEQPTQISAPPSFSPRLSVKDFFQFFIWEGQPKIAAVPNFPKSSPIPDEDDLDLNDFSIMF